MKKWLLHNLFWSGVLLVIAGAILGVFLSQISYFQINKEVSLGDLFIFVGGAIVTIYVASTITKSLSRIESIQALYQEEIKDFINFSTKLEDWIFAAKLPHSELISHLRISNIKLRSIDRLYKSSDQVNTKTLDPIIVKYNNLKEEITAISPDAASQHIMLNPTQMSNFITKYEDIKFDLLQAIINFQA